jgi:hypothetical protein
MMLSLKKLICRMMSWSGEQQQHMVGSPGPSGVADPNEILVFGYGCKLFRDDEKAGWIDREEHLIPCTAEPNVKVDRYDGRGALMDLQNYVAPPPSQKEHLDEDERELETVLDLERFMDLQEDSEFDDMDYQGGCVHEEGMFAMSWFQMCIGE